MVYEARNWQIFGHWAAKCEFWKNWDGLGLVWAVAWAVARWVLGVGRRFGALAAALLELVNL